MTIQLGDSIVAGHVDGGHKNSVHGWLQLTDRGHPILLHLTGNVPPPWNGRQVFFQSKDHRGWRRPSSAASAPGGLAGGGLAGSGLAGSGLAMASHQIGPLLDFQVTPGEEPLAGIKPHPPVAPATTVFSEAEVWIEWAGQDGRVVGDLVRAYVTIGGPWMGPHWAGVHPAWSPPLVDEDQGDENRAIAEAFSMFDLRNPTSEQDDPIDIAVDDHFTLVDQMLAGRDDVPIRSLFEPPIVLAPADALDDEQIDSRLLAVLASLASRGIGLDICEHFSPRQAYELLSHQILDAPVFPRLNETGYVRQFTTFEFCDRCHNR